MHEAPSPLKPQVPDLPDAVEKVIQRALAKRASDRFPTVNAFARAFATSATGVAVTASAGAIDSAPNLAPIAADSPSQSPPSTLSRSASELMPRLGRLRGRLASQGVVAAAGTAALVIVIGGAILHFRKAQLQRLPTPPVATPGPPVEPQVRPVVISPLPSSAAPPATAIPPAVPARPLKPDFPPPEEPKHRRIKASKPDAIPALSSPAVEPPKNNVPRPQVPSKTPPKHHLIEEL